MTIFGALFIDIKLYLCQFASKMYDLRCFVKLTSAAVSTAPHNVIDLVDDMCARAVRYVMGPFRCLVCSVIDLVDDTRTEASRSRCR